MLFKTELESIQWLVGHLRKSGYTDINPTQWSNQFSYFDIDAVAPSGHRVRIECKRRNMNHDAYGDAIIELSKYRQFLNEQVIEFDVGILVNFFFDAVTLSFIDRNYISIDNKKAKATTEFSDSRIFNKSFVHFRQNIITNYDKD